MATDDLFFLSIGALAERIRSGDLSPIELTGLALARIEALDPELHAFVTVTPDRAMAEAKLAEAALRDGRAVGPLHGVPIALKDLIDTQGIATEAGTRAMSGRVPAVDATVAARLRDAGAILLGKLAMAEGAFAEHRPERPAPVNPWRGDAWTGVSSSGAGVALASGLCFGAIGSDTGGSIRFPSSACGVTGLKPSWGRVSRSGIVPMASSLDHVGPMARSARDCALILNLIAGADPSDPTASRAAVPDHSKPSGANGLRVGIDPACLADLHPEVTRALQQALAVLASEGTLFKDISLPDSRHLAAGWAVTCGVETAIFHQAAFESDPEIFGPALTGLIHLGRTVPASEYARLHAARLVFAGEVDTLFDEVDMIAMPALPMPPPPNAALDDAASNPDMVAALLRFTAPWNYSGHPALTMPCGFSSDGLPIGFQLIGPRFGEAPLLAAGDAFQQASDWHRRRPPMAAARKPAPGAPSGSPSQLRACA